MPLKLNKAEDLGSRQKKFLKTVYNYIKYVLPLILLILVFSRVDINKLYNNFTHSDSKFIIIGIFLSPLIFIIGAFRWYLLIKKTEKINYFFILKHYWIGLGLGYFVPSSIGWDFYRVISIGKRTNNYLTNIVIIVYEKLTAFITCGIIIFLFLPFLNLKLSSNQNNIIITILIFFFIAVVSIVIFFLSFRSSFIKEKLKWLIEKTLSKFEKVTKISIQKNNNMIGSGINNIKLADLLITFFFSFIIQVFSAISTQLFFQSVHYEINLTINLFVTSVLFIIFVLPISFGSIGVREISYITMYGIFSVPPEVAVSISILTFLGVILNNSIGLIILFFDNLKKKQNKNLIKNDSELISINNKS
jgi:uncharacterized protein (TIRG00374 family)